jgi:hypothetical protein
MLPPHQSNAHVQIFSISNQQLPTNGLQVRILTCYYALWSFRSGFSEVALTKLNARWTWTRLGDELLVYWSLGQTGAEGVDMEPEATEGATSISIQPFYKCSPSVLGVSMLVDLEALTEVWVARLLWGWILFQGRWHLTVYHLAAHVFKICRVWWVSNVRAMISKLEWWFWKEKRKANGSP